jgi:ABC-type uncharacterized transport system permease subunit
MLASLKRQALYPTSAVLATLAQFLVTGIEVVAICVVFDRFGAVQG